MSQKWSSRNSLLVLRVYLGKQSGCISFPVTCLSLTVLILISAHFPYEPASCSQNCRCGEQRLWAQMSKRNRKENICEAGFLLPPPHCPSLICHSVMAASITDEGKGRGPIQGSANYKSIDQSVLLLPATSFPSLPNSALLLTAKLDNIPFSCIVRLTLL